MNSNRKTKFERTRTPVQLNASEYIFKSNTAKKCSPLLSRRPNINETIGSRPSNSTEHKFKTSISTNNEIGCKREHDSVYNDYLQAQLKKQIVVKKVKEHIQILEDQLLIQNENVYKRQQNLKEIMIDTDKFKTRHEIIQTAAFLEENLLKFANLLNKYDITVQLHNFKKILNLKCDKIILRNVKAPECQEEYDRFINTLELCLSITQKVTLSSRNFKEIHDLAESIRKLYNIMESAEQSSESILKSEKDIVYNFLQNMSEFFATKYEHSC